MYDLAAKFVISIHSQEDLMLKVNWRLGFGMQNGNNPLVFLTSALSFNTCANSLIPQHIFGTVLHQNNVILMLNDY